MSRKRILVVEDEAIIAEDIEISLNDMGYEVVAVVSTGEDALRESEEKHPDLVLMDVVLGGDMDGIETANRIRQNLHIPVIYLTAYTDDKMLERAKITEPFGYMIKPIRERELYTNIEMALFKHELDKKLLESRQWFSVTLRSIGDAVIATDRNGLVKFMNPVSESLTGWAQHEAQGMHLMEVFQTLDEKTGEPYRALGNDLIGDVTSVRLAERCTLLKSRDGTECFIDTGAAPIKDDTGDIIGIVLVFRDVTARKRVQERLALLSAAVEQSTEGIAVVDLEGNLLFLNQAFASLHGYTAEELAGQHLEVFHILDQMPSVEQANRTIQEQGEFSGEIWHARRDGSVFPGSCTIPSSGTPRERWSR